MSDVTTLTLADFLMARIAETAELVDTIPDWYCTESARGEGWGSRGNCPVCDQYMFEGTEDVTKIAMWDHLEDFHQRRQVLAECEAKRRTVEWCSAVDHAMPSKHLAHGILVLIAQQFADHPDYREEWKP